MNVLSLFDGMSCGQIALNRANIPYNKYYASEIEESSIKVALDNFPSTIQVGDVRDLESDSIDDIDLLIGGSPCQGFSVSGKRKGSTTKEGVDVISLNQYLTLKELGFAFEGQSYLFWEYVRLLKELKPKYFLLENVRVSKKWLPMFNETMGVEGVLINSNTLSAQNRPRYYWTNIPNFTIPSDKNITLESILENKESEKPLSPYMSNEFNGVSRLDKGIFNFFDKDKACCLTRGSGHGNKLIINRKESTFRKLTRNEMERLQTVPDNYTKSVSINKAGNMLGNGWTVDVIAHIFKNLK